jgi:hypothetical protein
LIEQNAPKAEAEPAGRYLPATRFAQQGGIMRVRDASNLGICAFCLFIASNQEILG